MAIPSFAAMPRISSTSRAGLDAAEVEALAARQDGDRDLADLGGGEDELHMLGRLFQRLQQAVEGRLRQHVHFVDDVDLVAGDRRLVARRLDDLADVVDAGVGGGVHLDHVDMAAFHDRGAVLAEFRHVDGRPVDLAGDGIVERAGEDARGRGLADAADAGEHVGLRDAAGAEGIGQRPHHRLLADQVGEALRPVFAREHAIGAAAGCERLLYAAVHRLYDNRDAAAGRNTNPLIRSAMPKERGSRHGRPAPKLVRAASFRT